jgi:hypothetical protein
MNKLEKFKNYEITYEQTKVVLGGRSYCQMWNSCQNNATAAAYGPNTGLSNSFDKDLLWRNLSRSCNDNFWGGCWAEITAN